MITHVPIPLKLTNNQRFWVKDEILKLRGKFGFSSFNKFKTCENKIEALNAYL